MADFRLDFDEGESYQSGGPAEYLGATFGHGVLEGFRIGDDGFVVMDFGNGKFRKIPSRRLLRITEG